jgi:hypothetical protein
MDPQSEQSEALHLAENLIGRFTPLERFTLLVVNLYVRGNRGLELRHTCM